MYLSVNEVKHLAKKNGYIVKDISGASSFGYVFGIFKAETVTEPFLDTRAVGEVLVESESVYEPDTVNKAGQKGAFRTVFNRSAVEALFNGL